MRPSRVRLERTRDFGDLWLALGLWRMLCLDALYFVDELHELFQQLRRIVKSAGPTDTARSSKPST